MLLTRLPALDLLEYRFPDRVRSRNRAPETWPSVAVGGEDSGGVKRSLPVCVAAACHGRA